MGKINYWFTVYIYYIILNRNGDCLATISSSQNKKTMESWGLESDHGFAIYRVKEVNGLKLIMIKNPWGNNKVWKGKYGPEDDCWENESFKTVIIFIFLFLIVFWI